MVSGRGFSLVELLVASTLLLLAMGLVAALAIPVLDSFEADPAAADLHQRVRSLVHSLRDDLLRTGSGFFHAPDDGPGLALPAVLPDRIVPGPWAVQVRPDTVSTWHAHRSAAQSVTTVAVGAGDNVLPLDWPGPCAPAVAACGFRIDDEVVLVAPHGHMAVATVRQVLAPLALVISPALAAPWPAGTAVSVVRAHSYERRDDAATGLSQVVRRLGGGPATPVVDFVTRFDVAWVVAAGSPSVYVSPDGTEQHATAGPAPPPVGLAVDPAWPPGENCAFFRDAAGIAHWRGSAGNAEPQVVSSAIFADGPWCPSPVAAVRWDADLVRLVELRVVIGVAAAASALRPAMSLGLGARPSARRIPDLVVEGSLRVGRHGGGI